MAALWHIKNRNIDYIRVFAYYLWLCSCWNFCNRSTLRDNISQSTMCYFLRHGVEWMTLYALSTNPWHVAISLPQLGLVTMQQLSTTLRQALSRSLYNNARQIARPWMQSIFDEENKCASFSVARMDQHRDARINTLSVGDSDTRIFSTIGKVGLQCLCAWWYFFL